MEIQLYLRPKVLCATNLYSQRMRTGGLCIVKSRHDGSYLLNRVQSCNRAILLRYWGLSRTYRIEDSYVLR